MAAISGRDVLPIPDRPPVGTVHYDAKDPEAAFPPITQIRPPAGAPNVLVILLDDVGFGASTTFGGPCRTPTADRLAGRGLKYNRFHTTALCAPTRAALLTGRNHHAVGMGSITETATSAPGYNSMRPNTCAPLAEILRLNGYATAQFGKCHEVPAWETSPIGPFDLWPTSSGFQHFYGFVAGETNQYYPALWEGTTPAEPWGTPEQGYHLMPDLADKAIGWIKQQRALSPDQPFFTYFAPGATHAPHQVPEDWADRYKGTFDDGWDELRARTFAQQKQRGLIPQDAKLTERHEEIPAWDDMPAELRPVLVRQMEIYAGFLEYADFHIGRVVDAVEQLGELDNTLIFYIVGDNGASAEGTVNGTFNEAIAPNSPEGTETARFMLDRLDKFGGPEAYNHYAVGWAHAMNTPYQWTKQVASHWGGTRNGTVVHWPAKITAHGGTRSQFTHVIDIAPTVLEAVGLPEPSLVNGVTQTPMHGTSMTYTFDAPEAAERHQTQYFEMFGNRGIYHKGWSAVTKHRTPWDFMGRPVAFDDDVWELYDAATDETQAVNLAAEHPDKLHELQRLWLIQAARHNVLPLDDRTAERLNSDLAGRPTLVKGKAQTLFPGMGRLTENCVINVRNKSHSVTAKIGVPEGGPATGVIVNQGGSLGGWTLFADGQGRLTYLYNHVGIDTYTVTATGPLTPGEHQVRMEFSYDGGGIGLGGDAALFVDGQQLGAGRVEKTHRMSFSLDETTDVGRDSGSAVTTAYPAGDNAFTGSIDWVRIDIGDDSHDHLIDPADLVSLLITRQ